MNFLVRSAETSNLQALYDLARKASLFHLPADKDYIEQLVQTSVQSFKKNTPPMDAVYLFVIEDVEKNKIVGTYQIIANYASAKIPYYYFQVSEKEFNDKELSISKNQRFLKLKKTTQELSAIGGVVIDRDYRASPEKIGKQIVQTSFIYMGMFPNRFKDRIIAELMAPVNKNGVNLFWKYLGERFTGLSNNKALQLLRNGKTSFIENLFPKEKIFLSLIDDQINPSPTRIDRKYGSTAQSILSKSGFQYLNNVDIEGSQLYGAIKNHIHLVRKIKSFRIMREASIAIETKKYLGVMQNGVFRGGRHPCQIANQIAYLPEYVADLLQLNNGDCIFISPVD